MISKRYFQQNETDCLRCAFATLLNICYVDVPDFFNCIKSKNDITSQEAETFEKRVDEWLINNGYIRIGFDLHFSEEMTLPHVSIKPFLFLGVLKKKENKYSHSVILELKKNELRIVHDPNANSGYDLTDLIAIEFILKVNSELEAGSKKSR